MASEIQVKSKDEEWREEENVRIPGEYREKTYETTEIRRAVMQLKNGKAVPEGRVPSEIWKEIVEDVHQQLTVQRCKVFLQSPGEVECCFYIHYSASQQRNENKWTCCRDVRKCLQQARPVAPRTTLDRIAQLHLATPPLLPPPALLARPIFQNVLFCRSFRG